MKLKEKSMEDKAPFLINMLNLYFRKAYLENIEYMAGRSNLEESPFQYYKRVFERRFNRRMTKYEALYWDILFDINIRSKSFPDILSDAEIHDPEKEAFIRKVVLNPKYKLEKKIFYSKKM